MIIGYARVSTTNQNLDRQHSMLKEYGCEKIIEEKFTGTVKDRQGLQTLMNVIRANDIVMVENISRLDRKTIDILTIIQEFEGKRQIDPTYYFRWGQSIIEISF